MNERILRAPSAAVGGWEIVRGLPGMACVIAKSRRLRRVRLERREAAGVVRAERAPSRVGVMYSSGPVRGVVPEFGEWRDVDEARLVSHVCPLDSREESVRTRPVCMSHEG